LHLGCDPPRFIFYDFLGTESLIHDFKVIHHLIAAPRIPGRRYALLWSKVAGLLYNCQRSNGQLAGSFLFNITKKSFYTESSGLVEGVKETKTAQAWSRLVKQGSGKFLNIQVVSIHKGM